MPHKGFWGNIIRLTQVIGDTILAVNDYIRTKVNLLIPRNCDAFLH